MGERKYTDEQIESVLMKALAEQNVKVIPGLIAVLALQNPERAEHVRQLILRGLAIASANSESSPQTTSTSTGDPES